MLEKNIDKVDWDYLSQNPAIFEIDYQQMAKTRTHILLEEMMKKVHHPERIKNLMNIQLNKPQYSNECNKNDIINPLHISVSNVFFDKLR